MSPSSRAQPSGLLETCLRPQTGRFTDGMRRRSRERVPPMPSQASSGRKRRQVSALQSAARASKRRSASILLAKLSSAASPPTRSSIVPSTYNEPVRRVVSPACGINTLALPVLRRESLVVPPRRVRGHRSLRSLHRAEARVSEGDRPAAGLSDTSQCSGGYRVAERRSPCSCP